MSSVKLQLGSLLLVLLATVPAWTQSERYSVPAASVEEQFSAYHDALSDAADGLLAASSQPGTDIAQSGSQAKATKLDDNALRQFALQYWNGQEVNVRRAAERVVQLRATLDPILQQEGVPVEVAALVLIESGGRATALSPKGALGLWQFMPETARRFGLAVGPDRDERLDLAKSTRAAARYLRDLYARFGDWSLVFAAYNAGEQSVERAMGKVGTRDFDSLTRARQLPQETRNYVPAAFSAIQLLGGKSKITAIQPAGRRSIDSRVLFASTEGGS